MMMMIKQLYTAIESGDTEVLLISRLTDDKDLQSLF